MGWSRQIDGYCERLGPEYWAEPWNAVTNAAFLIAALILAMRLRGGPFGLSHVLVGILAAIGIGSYLFHTHATVWAVTADAVPILLFILVYIFAINRDVWQLSFWPALGLTGLFFPYAALVGSAFGLIPWLGGSAGYAPVALLIPIYAALLWRREPETARGLALGGGLSILSLTFRTIDEPLCDFVPRGTHFLWHVINGIVLGWMIHVYQTHIERASHESNSHGSVK